MHIYEFYILDTTVDNTLDQEIDDLMTYHGTMEHLLVPSSIDYAISEVALDATWWSDAATAGNWETRFGITDADLPTEGRFIYMVMVSESMPFEHTNEPIYYPKRDQEDSATHSRVNPVYKYDSVNDELTEYVFGAPVFISYVSPNAGVTATATTTGTSVIGTSNNPYGQEVLHASITGPEGPIETVIINPGSAAVPEEWPQFETTQGYLGSGIYPTEPLQPNTLYTVYYNMTTTDGPYNDYWSFTTGPSNATSTASPTARVDRSSERGIHPMLRTQVRGHAVGPR